MPTRYAWDLADVTQIGPDIIPISPDDNNNITSTAQNGDTIVGVRAIRSENDGVMRVLMAAGEISGTTRDIHFNAGETRQGMFLRVLRTGTSVLTDSADTGIEGHV